MACSAMRTKVLRLLCFCCFKGCSDAERPLSPADILTASTTSRSRGASGSDKKESQNGGESAAVKNGCEGSKASNGHASEAKRDQTESAEQGAEESIGFENPTFGLTPTTDELDGGPKEQDLKLGGPVISEANEAIISQIVSAIVEAPPSAEPQFNGSSAPNTPKVLKERRSQPSTPDSDATSIVSTGPNTPSGRAGPDGSEDVLDSKLSASYDITAINTKEEAMEKLQILAQQLKKVAQVKEQAKMRGKTEPFQMDADAEELLAVDGMTQKKYMDQLQKKKKTLITCSKRIIQHFTGEARKELTSHWATVQTESKSS